MSIDKYLKNIKNKINKDNDNRINKKINKNNKINNFNNKNNNYNSNSNNLNNSFNHFNFKINTTIDEYDVVIIGAGPIGCITGENIKNGKVLIVEEHNAIGVPLQCAGIISKKGVKELGNPKGCVNTVRGAHIYSKNQHIQIGNEEIRAYIFERKIMDKDIGIRAVKNKNIDIWLKSYGKVKDNKDECGVSIVKMGKNYNLNPKIIVGADGAKSTVGKSLNLVNKREILSGAQIEFVNVNNIDDDFVYIFCDRDYCEDFFIWIIPMGKDRVRVGLCDNGNTYNKLINFVNNHPIGSKLLKNAIPVEFSVGTLPIGYSKTVYKNVLLVGDSAGHVKPLSGGGLYYGAKCAKICGKVIDEYLLNKDKKVLKEYEKKWKNLIKREIDFGLRFRKILKKMDNRQYDKLLKFINDYNLTEFINKYGDMDSPSIVVKKVFKECML